MIYFCPCLSKWPQLLRQAPTSPTHHKPSGRGLGSHHSLDTPFMARTHAIWNGPGCGGSKVSTCALHRMVHPPQTVASSECSVAASGTAAAALGLVPLAWKPLKLGTVAPTGWLRDQLLIFANGLSGATTPCFTHIRCDVSLPRSLAQSPVAFLNPTCDTRH